MANPLPAPGALAICVRRARCPLSSWRKVEAALQILPTLSFTSLMEGSPFRFRLERVRELRERREDEARRELASALAEHFRAEERLRDAEQRIESARAAQLEAVRAPRSGTDLLARQFYLERTETVRSLTREVVDQSEAQVDHRRALLTEAARERQALERLKQRRQAEHAAEAARVECLTLDEIAINNFRRRAA
jgi:flagellar FliJ protein